MKHDKAEIEAKASAAASGATSSLTWITNVFSCVKSLE